MLRHSVKVFCIFLALLGSSCSLQDHTVPEPETPDPETPVTNEFKVSTTGVKQEGDKLYLQGNVDQVDPTFKNRGEIGFLVSSRVTNDGPISPDPRLNNDPNVRFYYIKSFGKSYFDSSFTPLETGDVSELDPFTFTEQYFRTVIRLDNGKVYYGNVIHRSDLSLPANPAPWEIITNNIDLNYLKLSIPKRGQIPATELGFVVSYKEKESDKINNMPTIIDKKIMADWKMEDGDFIGEIFGSNTAISKKVDFNYTELYYRSYLILQDGSVVYGNVMHVQK